MKQTLKDRIIASAIHIAISLVILMIILAIVLFVWFPNGLFQAGASQGLTILVLVDLVLGPLLTFIVFNKTKKSLKFDLSCIAVLQLAFLGYGLYLIYNERPVIYVLADDGLNLITLSETKTYDMDKSYSILSSPDYVLMQNPDNRQDLYKAKTLAELVDARPYVINSELHKPMATVSEQEYNDYIQFVYDGLLGKPLVNIEELKTNKQQANCDWVPLISYHTSGYACINQSDGIEMFYPNKQSKQ